MQNSLVSILIPVYNAGHYLLPAVQSVINQTYKNLEIIIIDDGSTDNCLDTITDIKDQRIKILTQKKNYGRPVALNRALEVMTGEFYAIQDADDLSYPRRIEYLVNAMEQNIEVAGVFSGYDIIINGNHVAPQLKYKTIEECADDIEKMRMPSHDPTGMFRKVMVKKFKYHHSFIVGAAWDYILRVGEQHPLLVIGECLYSYRINQFSTIRSDPKRRIKKIQEVLQRTHKRRGKFYTKKVSKKAQNASFLYDIEVYFMESVLDLKKSGNSLAAFKTALICLLLNPINVKYYKPIIYFFLPLSAVRCYRLTKLKIKLRCQEKQ